MFPSTYFYANVGKTTVCNWQILKMRIKKKTYSLHSFEEMPQMKSMFVIKMVGYNDPPELTQL